MRTSIIPSGSRFIRPAASLTVASLLIAGGLLISHPVSAANQINATAGAANLAQDGGDSDSPEVTPSDVEKYVAVYKATQHDRTLTVEQAAARQGLSLSGFRQLENRIQRDDAALQHARDELQDAAPHATKSGSPAAEKTAP